jgi:ankyrin repeat protein
VKIQDKNLIQRLVSQNPALLRYQEPQGGMSLLQFAVFNNFYRSAEALVQAGADPNLRDTYHGDSPLSEAAENYKSSRFLRLLLAHGGDPNLEAIPSDSAINSSTVLLKASTTNLINTQLLVEGGAT